MKKSIAATAVMMMLTLTGLAVAKDCSNEYQMGTLAKVPLHVGNKVSTRYTDTDPEFGAHCTGGIVNDYAGKLVADMPDGSEAVRNRAQAGQ